MEDGPAPRTCDKSRSVSGRVAHELLSDFLRPLVIGNVAENEPAKRDQLDETNSTVNGSVTTPDVRFQTVDLRSEIEHRDRPVCDRKHGDAVQIGHVRCANHDRATSGRFGGAIYGHTLDDQAIGPSTPSLMRGLFPALTYSVRMKSTTSSLSHRPPHVECSRSSSMACSISK